MPYVSSNDNFTSHARTPGSFGRKGRAVSASDTVDIIPYARLLVTVGGTLVILPVENADGETLNLGTVTAGFIVPYEARRVMSTGSTATVITID